MNKLTTSILFALLALSIPALGSAQTVIAYSDDGISTDRGRQGVVIGGWDSVVVDDVQQGIIFGGGDTLVVIGHGDYFELIGEEALEMSGVVIGGWDSIIFGGGDTVIVDDTSSLAINGVVIGGWDSYTIPADANGEFNVVGASAVEIEGLINPVVIGGWDTIVTRNRAGYLIE